jgi:hypothetical protein
LVVVEGIVERKVGWDMENLERVVLDLDSGSHLVGSCFCCTIVSVEYEFQFFFKVGEEVVKIVEDI